MERFFARLERVLEPVLAGLLAFITIGVFIQVVLRYVFAMSFLWGEELSLFAFIWCVFLGTAVCSWRHTHFSFDIFSEILRGRAAGVQRLAVDLCVLSVTVVMVVDRLAVLADEHRAPVAGARHHAVRPDDHHPGERRADVARLPGRHRARLPPDLDRRDARAARRHDRPGLTSC